MFATFKNAENALANVLGGRLQSCVRAKEIRCDRLLLGRVDRSTMAMHWYVYRINSCLPPGQNHLTAETLRDMEIAAEEAFRGNRF